MDLMIASAKMMPSSSRRRASMSRYMKALWVGIGSLSLIAGFVGVFLPLLPTTPFLLLAAFCYAKGSERLHQWLVSHPRFGPNLEAWRLHGAILPRAKIVAVAFMGATLFVSAVVGVAWPILLVQLVVMAGVGAFILSRPSPPR
ncbi:MAG: YbaN family protein [Flavobacteriaceae bacterium]